MASPRREIRSKYPLCLPALVLLVIGVLPLAADPPRPAEDPPVRPAKDLVGVWEAAVTFDEPSGGELVIRRGDPEWRAELRGVETAFRPDGDRLAFDLGDELGSFRGRVEGEHLRGHWVQPPRVTLNNAYATPVRFEGGPDQWSGRVAPLVDRLTLYLVLQEKPDGSVGGFFRNPERNLGRFLRFGSVIERDGRIEILDAENKGPWLTGDLRGDRLSIFVPQGGRTFDFRRIDPSAHGFAARTGASRAGSTVSLARPPRLDDGWSTATPQETGLDPAPLAALVQKISAVEVDSVSAPYVHSLLVARRGKLVVEEYFHDQYRGVPYDTRSAGKSFATALLGTAVDRGAFEVTTPVYEVLGERAGPVDDDPRRRRMTVEHLLTMSSGLHCDDGDSETPGNEDRMQSQSEEPDWIRYALRLPMAWEPGEHDVYCSADMHLLAGLLHEAEGRWVPELFDERLARPMDFGPYHLNLDPTGEGYLGGGMRLRPRDFLKLGQVYADGGTWNGRRIVSKEWIEASVTPRSSLNQENDYGYGWWIDHATWHDQKVRTYYASGNGGQLVIVVPELEMVVAFQAANYSDYRTWRQFREQWLSEYLLKAVPAP